MNDIVGGFGSISGEWVPSLRSQLVTARTYCRPKNEEGTLFESEGEMIDRAIQHQRNLWEVAKGKSRGVSRLPLTLEEENELQDLKWHMVAGRGSLAGRTLWLGGTETCERFAATNFNCSFLEVRTVFDVVDAYHLLLLGCFHPETKIRMSDGSLKSLKDICVNDKVVSFNVNSLTYQEDTVVGKKFNKQEEKIHLVFDDGYEVKCTENHEFFTTNRGWVQAKDLEEYDEIENIKIV